MKSVPDETGAEQLGSKDQGENENMIRFAWSGTGRAVFATTVLLKLAVIGGSMSPIEAQRQVVVPSGFDTEVGLNALAIQCTATDASRVQSIFPIVPAAAGLISGIALKRASNSVNWASDAPPISVDLDMGFGHAATTPPLFSFHFATNRDQDYRGVVSRRVVQFPAVPFRGDNHYPFSYRVPFDTPFATQSGRWALWELRVHGASPCSQDFTRQAVGANRNTAQRPTSLGLPCPPPFNSLYVPPLVVGWGNTAFLDADLSARPVGLEVLYLGSRADWWLGSALPIDLTGYGAPGCSVQVSLEFAWPQSLTASTRNGSVAYFALDIPNDMRLVGRPLFMQAVRYGTSAPLSVALSQGVRTVLGSPIPGVGGIVFGPLGSMSEYGQRVTGCFVTELTVW